MRLLGGTWDWNLYRVIGLFKAKLKWWYKLACMEGDKYPHKLFGQIWNIKPRRGRQRKSWSKVVDDLFSSLDLDKAEWVEDIQKG